MRRQVHVVLPLALVVLMSAASALHAQVADTATAVPRTSMDSAFARARALVVSGQTVAGRRVADSILAATPPGSPTYGDALYGHAMLAPTAAAAERDYQRIIVEYPLSAHAGDALLQLAQIERSQGKRAAAIHHLQRFLMENATGTARAQPGFWLAQLLFEQNDDQAACRALANARAALDPGDVELLNQMEFYSTRCAMAARAAADSVTRADSAARADSVARVDSLARVAARDSAGRAAAAARERARRTPSPAGKAVTGGYSVQVGAYEVKSAAEAAASRLRQRGLDARVDGDQKPFRVRVGHYTTSAAAASELARIQKLGIKGFVTKIDGR